MKHKKYLLFLLLIMVLGCNKTYAADTCYYISSDQKTTLTYNPSQKKAIIDTRAGGKVDTGKKDPLINKKKDRYDNETGITVPAVGNSCQEYIVYRRKNGFWFFDSDGIWGFNDLSLANDFKNRSESVKNMTAWMVTYKDKSGEAYTEEEYSSVVINIASGSKGNNVGGSQKTDIGGENIGVDCNELFGSKDDPNSIRYLIDEILQYPRIIVPILVIALGIIDLAKAVIASKEDEMKKAQKTFVKRVIIGVAFFFIPLFVDIIMDLADIVWEGLGYTTCDL